MRTTIALLAFAAAVPAPAQAPQTADDFGTEDDGIRIVGRHEFQPCGDLPNLVCAGLNDLPNGTLIQQIAFYVEVEDAPPAFTGYLRLDSANSSNGSSPWRTDFLVSLLTQELGRTVVFQNVDIPVLYRQDMDGDGEPDVVTYYLQAYTSADIDFQLARVRWRRQVSPAPPAATFNDVPANHPFFQCVEALAGSGITVGCGSGNYCPDAPVTRGQMAAFLAKALGLHWPWDAQ